MLIQSKNSKTFAKLEQALSQQTDVVNPYHIDQVQNQANAYKQQALDASQKIQALVKEESLSPLFGMQKTTRNPDQAPKGVMVFVSLTMPDTALKQLLTQSEHLGIPLVIRGVLPEGFPATAKRIESLIRSPNQAPIQSGFSISPDWFKQFDITKVPAFVSVKSGRCLPEQPCSNADLRHSLWQYLALSSARLSRHGRCAAKHSPSAAHPLFAMIFPYHHFR